MQRHVARSLISLLVLAGAVTAAHAGPGGLRYEVTITNLTAAQPLSPPIVVTHPRDFALFEPGKQASPALAILAKDGDPMPLADALAGVRGVHVARDHLPVPPGASTTLEVRARSPHSLLSVASMLVNTNDAFAAIDGARLPRGRYESVVEHAAAWDAGAEANNEDCDFIPGPACGSPGVDAEPLVTFVHVHPGIHGIGSLLPEIWDWRNPVARITVRRVVGR